MAKKKMKKTIMLFLISILSISISVSAIPMSTFSEDHYHDKAHGFHCDAGCHSVLGCEVFVEGNNAYVIVDESGSRCSVFRVTDSNTYNAAFRYCDCYYYLLIPEWGM